MSFYQTNNKILSKSINGAETIDFNKYPDLLDILFNHWISQKENYNRLNDNISRGQFEMSRSIVMDTFGIKETKAKNLIKRFVDDEIIKLKKRGNSSSKKSIYVYLSVLERVEILEKEKTKLEAKLETEQRPSKTLENQCTKDEERPSKDQVKDQANTHSKKELIKRINKNIYTEIFDYWISKGVYKHRELTKNMENAIESTLKDYTLEQIKEAIDNYSEMYKSDYKYCSYKWTLIEFLTRTQDKTNERQLELHLKEGVSYKRYLEYKSKAKDPAEEKTNLEIIDGYEYESI